MTFRSLRSLSRPASRTLGLGLAAMVFGFSVGAAVAGVAGAAGVARTRPAGWPRALATSVDTPSGTWATVAMGHLRQPLNTFWQLLYRPAASSYWSNQVKATATATNGGLVLAAGGQTLAVGIRPSLLLRFSPLISTTNAGRTWADGVLDEGLAAHPNALAIDPAGTALAVRNGASSASVLESAGNLSRWRTLVGVAALSATKLGRACRPHAITAVGFVGTDPDVGLACSRPGSVGLALQRGGRWTPAALVLPASVAHGTVSVLGIDPEAVGTAVVLGVVGPGGHHKRLLVSWTQNGSSWHTSSPLRLAANAEPVSYGPAGGSDLFVLVRMPDGSTRAYLDSAQAASWRSLPPPPAGTATLASGPGASLDALGAAGTMLHISTLTPAAAAWSEIQTLHVPIEFGSSNP